MKIGICDDELSIVQLLSELVRSSLKRINNNSEIISLISGKDLIAIAENLDVVFLDIEMPGLDGFQVGRKIKEINPLCKIIMATGRSDRFKEAFKINVFRYITKPFDQSEIDEAIIEVLKIQVGTDPIELYINRIKYMIQQREIAFFRAYNSYTEAVSEDICYRRDLSLKEINELLDDRIFFRISKQYIVNMLYIIDYRDSNIYLCDRNLLVSRRNRKEFEKKYIEFKLKYRG